jgi:hypothetical protein
MLLTSGVFCGCEAPWPVAGTCWSPPEAYVRTLRRARGWARMEVRRTDWSVVERMVFCSVSMNRGFLARRGRWVSRWLAPQSSRATAASDMGTGLVRTG